MAPGLNPPESLVLEPGPTGRYDSTCTLTMQTVTAMSGNCINRHLFSMIGIAFG